MELKRSLQIFLSIFLFFVNFFWWINYRTNWSLYPVYSHYYATIVFYEGVCRQICLVIFHILILCSRMCPQTHCDQIPQFLQYSRSLPRALTEGGWCRVKLAVMMQDIVNIRPLTDRGIFGVQILIFWPQYQPDQVRWQILNIAEEAVQSTMKFVCYFPTFYLLKIIKITYITWSR